jgi:uncharacterized protein YegP (UPF0339 family)
MSVIAQVHRTENGEWAARFLDDGNHEKLMWSETYVNKADAIRVLELVTGLKFGPGRSRLYNRRRIDGTVRVEVEE